MLVDLQMLARISPAAYGPLIVARNRALLEKLELLRPYIGAETGEVPSGLFATATARVPLGCPHCRHMSCADCLWMRAGGSGADDVDWCSFAPFVWEGRAMALNEVQYCDPGVVYSRHSCHIRCRGCIRRLDFIACEGFLRAHIEWGSSPDWGSAAVPDPFTDIDGKECDGSLLGSNTQVVV